jgi:hypothetical protein|eukprot:COSAG06_NODE_1894_length_8121_cov_19.363455_2_plen_122_part_00
MKRRIARQKAPPKSKTPTLHIEEWEPEPEVAPPDLHSEEAEKARQELQEQKLKRAKDVELREKMVKQEEEAKLATMTDPERAFAEAMMGKEKEFEHIKELESPPKSPKIQWSAEFESKHPV